MKILSRKIIASSIVFITATLFVWYGKIPGSEWVALAISTVVAYIAGEGVGAAIVYAKKNKRGAFLSSDVTSRVLTFKERVDNLLSAPFLAALLVYAVATFLMWNGKIGVTEWNYVAIGTIVGYDIINPLEKLRHQL